jgi:hypothetical protein
MTNDYRPAVPRRFNLVEDFPLTAKRIVANIAVAQVNAGRTFYGEVLASGSLRGHSRTMPTTKKIRIVAMPRRWLPVQ